MALRRWDPWRELREMRDEMDRLFGRFWGRPALPGPAAGESLETIGWSPAVDMYEKDDALVVKASLPGMEKDDIQVSVRGNTLSITGERKVESEVKEEDYYCCEQRYGKFARSISLPAGVDTDKISASYKNGILEVTLPKTEAVKPKQIEIKTA